jgi:predicted house-cleaning noncanonical NTP pyrophosphatase (MazG superfamily)
MDYKYSYSEILSLITQCKKEGLISDEERKTMKECIITKEPDLRVDLEEYQKDHDLRKLVETLKVMRGLTDMSSPADSGLMDLKRKRQQKKKSKKKPKEEEDIVLDDCELGKSPELNFTKKFNRDD